MITLARMRWHVPIAVPPRHQRQVMVTAGAASG